MIASWVDSGDPLLTFPESQGSLTETPRDADSSSEDLRRVSRVTPPWLAPQAFGTWFMN